MFLHLTSSYLCNINLYFYFKKLYQFEPFVWHTMDGLPPRDSPKCGFFNELCPKEPEEGELHETSLIA